MELAFDNIRKVEDLEDGSSVYEVGEPELEETEEQSEEFYANLAVNFSKEELQKLSSYLIDSIDEDIEARRDWLESVEKIRNCCLGIRIDNLKNKEDSINFSNVGDTTLLTAILRLYALMRGELYPSNGPVGFKIFGQSNDFLSEKGEKVRDWLNYYLTVKDKAYYPDSERMLLYLILYGSAFRKIYYDKLLEQPISRFIAPEDFIINNDCTSILESSRLTHVLHLSKKEILLKQQSGIYRDIELPYLKSPEGSREPEESDSIFKTKDGLDRSLYTKYTLFPQYEVHVDLNLEDFTNNNRSQSSIPLPYIIIIDKASKEILSIVRNWAPDDSTKQRINYFAQYNLLPGFGILGLGYAHLMGANSLTLNKLVRILVDAGSFKNLPGGLRVTGINQQDNDIRVGPGQWVPVDTGGMPLAEAFMPLPYSEPSIVLKELRNEIIAETKEVAAATELGMLNSKEDIPAATIFAVLEEQNRIQSAIFKSVHFSLSQELQLLNDLFSKTLSYEQFNFAEKEQFIANEDFIDEIKIIPVSDPSINSTFQRLIQAEYVLKTALQAPDLHNMRAIFARTYESLGIDKQEVEEKILKPEQEEQEILPLDPISENMNILLNKSVKAAIWQEHQAHILSHGLFAEEHPDTKPPLLAHIKEHQAFQYLIEMQQLLGFELPPLEQISDPQIQNTIALNIANKISDMENDNQNQAPLDPNMVMMADIEQKREETAAKERIANLKAETDIFKVQMDFEKEKNKIESNEDIAQLKAETELTKQENQNAY